jgi:hypothetical protein
MNRCREVHTISGRYLPLNYSTTAACRSFAYDDATYYCEL